MEGNSYWDNTSGATLDAALKNMSFFGLIVVRLISTMVCAGAL